MKINTGPWVDGDYFFGRQRELRNMGEILANKKASLMIPGPRRIGKTSLVMEFARLNRKKYKFIYLDLESRDSIFDLCRDLMKELKKHYPRLILSRPNLKGIWNALSEMIPKINVTGIVEIETGQIKNDQQFFVEEMTKVMGILYDYDFIFLFDEFSDFLLKLKKHNSNEVRFFLSWLRQLRQEGKARFVITGSINILSTLEELGLPDLMNDLADLEIFPLEIKEVEQLLLNLTIDSGISFNQEALHFIVKQLSDGIPFFIQLFASSALSYRRNNKEEYDLQKTRELYEKITGRQHKEFMDLHARLKEHLSPQKFNAAKKILAHTCSDEMSFEDLWGYVGEYFNEKEAFHHLLRRLCDESYLKKVNNNYSFVSPMIADWWRNSYNWEK